MAYSLKIKCETLKNLKFKIDKNSINNLPVVNTNSYPKSLFMTPLTHRLSMFYIRKKLKLISKHVRD